MKRKQYRFSEADGMFYEERFNNSGNTRSRWEEIATVQELIMV